VLERFGGRWFAAGVEDGLQRLKQAAEARYQSMRERDGS
jgi:hypothetical protein